MESKRELIPAVEALIFAAEQPIDPEKIAKILDADKGDVMQIIAALIDYYANNDNRGIEIIELGGGYFFRTKVALAPHIKKVVFGKEAQLSKSAMETLSVIAFKQPITRAEIEHVRGVDSSNAVRTLLEKKFIKILGRKDVPGRPHVYGTTRDFLKVFGLKDLSGLPNLKEIKEMEKSKETQMTLLGDEHEHKTAEDNS
jgi:segregation and condensation protein B